MPRSQKRSVGSYQPAPTSDMTGKSYQPGFGDVDPEGKDYLPGFDPNAKKYHCCCFHAKKGVIILTVLDTLLTLAFLMQVIGELLHTGTGPDGYVPNKVVYQLTGLSVILLAVLCSFLGLYLHSIKLMIPYFLFRLLLVGAFAGCIGVLIDALSTGLPATWLVRLAGHLSGRRFEAEPSYATLNIGNRPMDQGHLERASANIADHVAIDTDQDGRTRTIRRNQKQSVALHVILWTFLFGCLIGLLVTAWTVGVLCVAFRFLNDRNASSRALKINAARQNRQRNSVVLFAASNRERRFLDAREMRRHQQLMEQQEAERQRAESGSEYRLVQDTGQTDKLIRQGEQLSPPDKEMEEQQQQQQQQQQQHQQEQEQEQNTEPVSSEHEDKSQKTDDGHHKAKKKHHKHRGSSTVHSSTETESSGKSNKRKSSHHRKRKGKVEQEGERGGIEDENPEQEPSKDLETTDTSPLMSEQRENDPVDHNTIDE